MPNSQKHRGANPKDYAAFSEKNIDNLKQATSDLSWLLSNGYAQKASLKLVGDKFSLTDRQRKAINAASAEKESLEFCKMDLINDRANKEIKDYWRLQDFKFETIIVDNK